MLNVSRRSWLCGYVDSESAGQMIKILGLININRAVSGTYSLFPCTICAISVLWLFVTWGLLGVSIAKICIQTPFVLVNAASDLTPLVDQGTALINSTKSSS